MVTETDSPRDTWAWRQYAKTQSCPICLATPIKHATVENRGVILASYWCGRHMWSTRWVKDQGEAA